MEVKDLVKGFLLVSGQLRNWTQTVWLQNEEIETTPRNNFHQVQLQPGLKTVSNAASLAMAGLIRCSYINGN